MDISTRWMQNFEAEVNRLILFELGISLLAFLLGCWIMYLVLKAAIRDGIKESGLVRDRWQAEVQRHTEAANKMPDMKAD